MSENRKPDKMPDNLTSTLTGSDPFMSLVTRTHKHTHTLSLSLYTLSISSHKHISGGGPTPFFPKTHQNLDLVMGRNGEKSIWKERETNFLFSK